MMMPELELDIRAYPSANVIIKTRVGNYSDEDMLSIEEAKAFREKLLSWAVDVEEQLDHYLMNDE